MLLITRKKNHAVPPPIIFVGNYPLDEVTSVKYLFVQIKSDLSWSAHISSLCIKIRRLVGLLYHCFYKNAEPKILLQLYKAFIGLLLYSVGPLPCEGHGSPREGPEV